MNRRIQLVSLDLDGCVCKKGTLPEEASLLKTYDLSYLSMFSKYREKIVINTGRSWEALKPILDVIGTNYVISEHGMGYYFDGKRMGLGEIDSEYAEKVELMGNIKTKLLSCPDLKACEIQKDFYTALRVPNGMNSDEFYKIILDRLGDFKQFLDNKVVSIKLRHGVVDAIDIQLREITKADGIRLIGNAKRVPMDSIISIDDGDVDPMRVCGYAACPADSSKDVIEYVKTKGRRGYVANLGNKDGTLEILNRFLD